MKNQIYDHEREANRMRSRFGAGSRPNHNVYQLTKWFVEDLISAIDRGAFDNSEKLKNISIEACNFIGYDRWTITISNCPAECRNTIMMGWADSLHRWDIEKQIIWK